MARISRHVSLNGEIAKRTRSASASDSRTSTTSGDPFIMNQKGYQPVPD
jgi:hypothetical protein